MTSNSDRAAKDQATSPLDTARVGSLGCPCHLVMMHFRIVMRFPRSHRGTDTDCVDLGPHCVLHISGNEKKASNRVSSCPSLIKRRPHSNFQRARDDGHSRVLVVGVVLPVTGRNEKCISESLTRGIFVPLQHCPLASVWIGALPDDIARVPCFDRRLSKGKRSEQYNQYCTESLQILLLRRYVSGTRVTDNNDRRWSSRIFISDSCCQILSRPKCRRLARGTISDCD